MGKVLDEATKGERQNKYDLIVEHILKMNQPSRSVELDASGNSPGVRSAILLERDIQEEEKQFRLDQRLENSSGCEQTLMEMIL